MSIIYYHHPKCSKSRAGLDYLNTQTDKFSVRLYLEDKMSIQELKEIVVKLGLNSSDIIDKMVRSKEAKEAGITKDMSTEVILEKLSQNPKALQRPILVKGDQAVIGRPLENIIRLMESSNERI